MRHILPAILLILVTACFTEPDCRVSATNKVKIVLKTKKTAIDTTVTFSSVSVSGTDSIFYVGKSTSTLSLPVSSRSDHITITTHRGLQVDTIAVRYSPLNVIISPDCGAFVYYLNLEIDATSFSSIKVVNNQLSTSAPSNIEIKL